MAHQNDQNASEELISRQHDIEEETAALTGYDQETVKYIFNTFWNVMCDRVEDGHRIKLHGKGQFYISHRTQRQGRNPNTGELHPIPARDVMAFHTSPAYAKRLRAYRSEMKEQTDNAKQTQ